MSRNLYLNVLFTIFVLASVFFGVMVVNSIDLLRLRLEKVSDQIANLKISPQAAPAPGTTPSGDTTSASAPASNATSAVKPSGSTSDDIRIGQFANAEYYDKNAQPGGRFIQAISSETKNMNYLLNNEAFVSTLWEYAFDSLAERNYGDPEIFQPQLMESFSISEDKTTYTIKIKKGVLWHDFTDPVSGKEWKDVEVTARDFKFYVDVIKNEKTDCMALKVYFQDLEELEVISDYEFKVRWKKAYYLAKSTTLGLTPLPRHLYHSYDGPFDPLKFNDDHERNRIIVGCGPYRFLKWDKGQRIIMQRWDKYYGAKYGVNPPLEYLVFEVIPHPNTQFQALLSGAIDRFGLTPEQWVTRANGKEFGPGGHINKYKYPSRSYSYIGYNLTNPFFADRKTRVALSHLVDRERILKDAYYNLARIVTGPFFTESKYYDKSIKPYPFSVETASKLLAEAGWKDEDHDGILERDGKKFEFTILAVSNHPIQKKMLPVIKEDMAKAGVIMKIQSLEWPVYVQRIEKKSYEACTLSWTVPLEPDMYQVWHSSQADLPNSSNHVRFKNAEADKIIEELRVTFDMDKRVELCRRFHKILHEEQPYTFLFSPDSLLGQNNSYQNVRVFPEGVPARLMWLPKKLQKPVPNLQ